MQLKCTFPYEKDRVIPNKLGKTEMGRDLLAQDYMLKQLTASLMYPEEELGKNFWDRVYTKAQARYDTTEIPMDTFNKVWIVPEKANVHVNGNNIFVVDNHLKVMLEKDYLALDSSLGHNKHGVGERPENQVKEINDVSSEVVREVIIPEIEREVNYGKNFANLRQIFNSMILATWYKQNLRESLLGQVYTNQNKVQGIDLKDKQMKEKIYNQYVEAFKKGVYNYIKEDYDDAMQKIIPRKYFSGGFAGDKLGVVGERLGEQEEVQAYPITVEFRGLSLESSSPVIRLSSHIHELGDRQSSVKHQEVGGDEKLKAALEGAAATGNLRMHFWNMLVTYVPKTEYQPPQNRVTNVLSLGSGKFEDAVVLHSYFGGSEIDGMTNSNSKIFGIDIDDAKTQRAIKLYQTVAVSEGKLNYSLPKQYDFITGDATNLDNDLSIPEEVDVVVIRHQQISDNEEVWSKIFQQGYNKLRKGGIMIITSFSDVEHDMMIKNIQSQGYDPIINESNPFAVKTDTEAVSEDRRLAIIRKDENIGGIDLNPNTLDLNVQGDEIEIDFSKKSQLFNNISVGGFLPVIINVAPITNIPMILGESEEQSDTPKNANHTPKRDPANHKEENYLKISSAVKQI